MDFVPLPCFSAETISVRSLKFQFLIRDPLLETGNDGKAHSGEGKGVTLQSLAKQVAKEQC